MDNEQRYALSNYHNNHYFEMNKNIDMGKFKKIMKSEFLEFVHKNSSVLDLGCGTGRLLKVFESEGVKNLVGVEMDRQQFDIASKELKHAKVYHKGALEFLKERAEKFDVIFMVDFLEHISKDSIIDILKLTKERLGSKGILVIRTINADSPLFSGKMRYLDFTHEISFNEDSMRCVLKEAGFANIMCRATKYPLLSPLSSIVLVVRVMFETLIRFYLRTYFRNAFHAILTPNFVTIAKNAKQ